MHPLSFEKDDDSNGHIDFITASSVSQLNINNYNHYQLNINNYNHYQLNINNYNHYYTYLYNFSIIIRI